VLFLSALEVVYDDALYKSTFTLLYACMYASIAYKASTYALFRSL